MVGSMFCGFILFMFERLLFDFAFCACEDLLIYNTILKSGALKLSSSTNCCNLSNLILILCYDTKIIVIVMWLNVVFCFFAQSNRLWILIYGWLKFCKFKINGFWSTEYNLWSVMYPLCSVSENWPCENEISRPGLEKITLFTYFLEIMKTNIRIPASNWGIRQNKKPFPNIF